MSSDRPHLVGPAIGGPLDGQRLEFGRDEICAPDGTRYLWTPILVDGKAISGFWKVEYVGDAIAIEILVSGYRKSPAA